MTFWPAQGAPDPFTTFRQVGAVDTTCFLGDWPARLSATSDGAGLTAYADRFGLSALWVSHLASLFAFDTRRGNEALLDACETDRRLRPFAVVNPIEQGWERELSWARSIDAQGIRISPGHHGYSLDCTPAAELRDAVAELGVPLHLVVRLEDERVRHPRLPVLEPRLAEVAEFVRPAARDADGIVVSGLNRGQRRELDDLLAGDATHLLADLWFVNGPTGVLDQIAEDGEHTRFCFGSAHPIQTPEATALQLEVADLSPDQRRAMLRGNAEAVSPAARRDV